ncbi:MAG: hypothetical protein AAFU54_12735 [Chloroflexota bacterium]
MSSFLKNPTVAIVAGYFPKLTTTALAVVCFALGMIWAYAIAPVQYIDGNAAQLEQSFQDQWVMGAAGRWAARNAEIDDLIRNLLAEVDDPQVIVASLQSDPNYAAEANLLTDAQFQQFVVEAQQNAASAPARGGIFSNFIVPIIVLVVFAILFILGKVLWTLLVWPFIEPTWARMTGAGRDESASDEIIAIKDRNARMAAMQATAVESTQYGDPVIRKLSLFKDGYGNYDDSFNIETDAGMYYGEAGATIADTDDAGSVTAIEVWMFDKDEFANTPTVTFATDAAMADATAMAKMQGKGDVVKLTPGTKSVLETNALYVEAIARDVDYKADNPNALNESSIEIIAWSKAGAPGGGSAPSGDTVPAPAMPEMPGMPSMPSSPPPPPGGGSTPLAPPPLDTSAMPGFSPPGSSAPPPPPGAGNPPPEDPFSGAGDFTPVNPNK